MVKKLREQLLRKAAELGWDTVVSNGQTITLTPHDSVLNYSISAAPDKLLDEIRFTLHTFNEDQLVKSWLEAHGAAHEGVSISQLVADADNIHESLHWLLTELAKVAEDFDAYISGMSLSKLLGCYEGNGVTTATLWQQIQGNYNIRTKKTGTGHATRWWYHKDDVVAFCEKYVRNGKVVAPSRNKLNGFYVFVGPSGSGKTSVMNELQKGFGYASILTCTDRPARYEGEPGHVFLTESEFDTIEMVACTTFAGHRYGILPELVGYSDMAAVDINGISVLKDVCRKQGRPIHVIGVDVHGGWEELQKRMRDRGDSMADAYKRYENDRKHFAGFERHCDVVIKNDNLSVTVQLIKGLVDSWERADRKMVSEAVPQERTTDTN